MTTFAQALAHAQRGEFAAAAQILAAVVKRERKNADALHLYANVLHAQGDAAAALMHFAAAAKLAPADAALAFNHAVALAAAQRHAEAADAFARALTLRPNDAEAHFARGASLNAIARYDEALAAYDAAHAAGLNRPDLHANRGAALAALGRHAEALAALDTALARAPNDAKSHFNRGAALIALDRSEDALAALDRALALAPDHIAARAHRATARANLGRFDEALADIDAAIAAQPDRLDHLKRRAYVLSVADRRAEALPLYDRILAQTPDDQEARYNKADALLVAGDYAEGWDYYEARFFRPGTLNAPPSPAPLWTGAEPLAGKTILVQSEQGFGDLFQFCRFIPDLAARGARVIVQERPQTHALLRSLAGVDELAPTKSPPPAADYRISTNSLARILGARLETLPGAVPYLHAEPERIAQWRDRLGAAQRRRIGLCWAGTMNHPTQRTRRLDAAALELLLALDADIISLQFDPGLETALLERYNARNLGPDAGDFADLAALIANLDLVITADTVTAHVAGAIGKPVWIMLPHCADWRWLRARDDTPWYPQARLFRQSRYGDWRDVIDRIAAALQ